MHVCVCVYVYVRTRVCHGPVIFASYDDDSDDNEGVLSREEIAPRVYTRTPTARTRG